MAILLSTSIFLLLDDVSSVPECDAGGDPTPDWPLLTTASPGRNKSDRTAQAIDCDIFITSSSAGGRRQSYRVLELPAPPRPGPPRARLCAGVGKNELE